MKKLLAPILALLLLFGLADPVAAASYSKSPLEECQLKETQNLSGAGPKGFPTRTRNIPNLGTVKVVIAGFDYVGNEGTKAERDFYFKNLEKKIEEWSRYWSKGKMVYDVVIHSSSWIRVEDPNVNPDVNALAQAADPFIDFSGTHFFFPFFPPNEQLNWQLLYGERVVSVDEGTIPVFSFAYSARTINTAAWVIHELLHPQGFIGHGPANGEQLGLLMNQASIKNTGITSWESFLNGWWGKDEILCLEASKIISPLTISLGFLDKLAKGYEAAVIKLNEEEAIVIERRGPGPYSTLKDSMTVYKLNVNKPSYRCDSCQERDSQNWWQYLKEKDGDLFLNRAVSYQGVTVSLAGKGKVKITVKQTN